MLREEAERRVVVAANRDAELHQQLMPGEPVDELWAATRWETVATEPDLAVAVRGLGDMAGQLYRESLRTAARVLAQLVKLRIENWLDLALDPDFRGTLTETEVEQLNQKLSKLDQVLLVRAGGAGIVARYTELKPR